MSVNKIGKKLKSELNKYKKSGIILRDDLEIVRVMGNS